MNFDTVAVPDLDDIEASPTSFDLYREVHKGLRHALFDLTVEVGRADVTATDVRQEVIDRALGVVALLHAHHGHEDTFIQPLVEAHAPRLAAIIEAGHIETEQDLVEIEGRLTRLARAGGSEEVAAGRELYSYLALFTARYLAHMALEEGAVMAELRAALSLDELEGIEVALRSAIAPPLMVQFMGVMLPAMDVEERTSMLAGMQDGAPAEVFEMFRQAAESSLSADDYSAVAARIGVA